MQHLSISRLQLHEFRNYKQLRLDVEPSPVILIGQNGAGKTNILEAISFFAPGRGLRNAALNEIDRKTGEGPHPWAVAATLRVGEELREIGTGRSGEAESNKRIVKLDGQLLRGHAELASCLSVIWLTPQMDPLFISAANVRRRFLDRLVYHFDESHASHILAYDHARAERAKLLKERRADPAWLTILERKMAETGVVIAAARVQSLAYVQQAIDTATGPFPKADLQIDGSIEAMLSTHPALQVEEYFSQELAASRLLDAKTGRTHIGIHRSDLLVTHRVKQMPAEACSTGEQKALLIAIILAEARARLTWHTSVPIVLLDEVVAHLDNEKRRALFAAIEDIGAQVWMTGTDNVLFEGMEGKAQFFKVEGGAVLPSSF